MRFLALVFVNLRRHKLRALIGVAGIGFGVAAMLTILSIVNGAIGMFERILTVDSHYLVFEKNVSDLFFSSVPDEKTAALRRLDNVESAEPLLFGLVTSGDRPIVTCFGWNRPTRVSERPGGLPAGARTLARSRKASGSAPARRNFWRQKQVRR